MLYNPPSLREENSAGNRSASALSYQHSKRKKKRISCCKQMKKKTEKYSVPEKKVNSGSNTHTHTYIYVYKCLSPLLRFFFNRTFFEIS